MFVFCYYKRKKKEYFCMAQYKISAYEGKRPYAFVSYSHLDEDIVFPVIEKLQTEYKYRLWFDSGIHSGENWSEKLTSEIEESTAFIVFLSPNSIQSRHCGSEIAIAFGINNIKIIPIWITKSIPLPSNLNYYLSFTQHALENSEDTPALDQIVAELNKSIPDSTRDVSKIENGILTNVEDDIHDLIVKNDITQIGDSACKQKIYLNTLILNKELFSIGNEAFRGCTSLKKVFIPKNVRRLGDSAFRDCVNLEHLVIENDIEIGERAFENCVKLKEVTLPSDLREIYSGVFNSCKSLEHIKLPSGLISIGDNAFAACDKLSEIDIPSSVTRLDDACFSGCTAIKTITLPEGVFKVGKNVFKDCTQLEHISIPSSVVKIDTGSFRGCPALRDIEVNKKNKHYKTMDGVMFNKNKSKLVCFANKLPFESYEIPDSVCDIEDWAFANCVNLKEVIIPDSVQRIGEGAFFHCESLESIVIPYSVDCIDDTAFRGCRNLKHVYIESKTIKDLGWGIFYGCSPELVVHYCSDIVREYCVGQFFQSEYFEFDKNK